MSSYKEKFKEVIKGRIAVFIDAANLERSVQDMWVNPKDVPEKLKHLTAHELRWSVDYLDLQKFFRGFGEVWSIMKIIYRKHPTEKRISMSKSPWMR